MNVVKLVGKKIKVVNHPLTLANTFSEQRVLTTSNSVFLENNEALGWSLISIKF